MIVTFNYPAKEEAELLAFLQDIFMSEDIAQSVLDMLESGKTPQQILGALDIVLDVGVANTFFTFFLKRVRDNTLKKARLTQQTFSAKEIEQMEIIVAKNVLQLRSIEIDRKKDLSRIISDTVIYGQPISSTIKELKSLDLKIDSRLKTISLTETAQANSIFARQTMDRLNITKASWSGAKDKRERKCHLEREGKEYEIKTGLYSYCDGKTIQAGMEVRCRCAMVVVL